MSKMTETEKEIALLRHEANRLRLFGRLVSSKALEDKANALTREAGMKLVHSHAVVFSMHQAIAQFIARRPEKLVEALSEINPHPPFSPPEEVAKWVAGALVEAPGYITSTTWQAILKVVKAEEMEFALTLPMVSDVDFVISLIERSIDAVKGGGN